MTFTLIAVVVVSIAAAAAVAHAPSDWSTAQKIDEIDGNSSELNTPFLDGCPILSPDGRRLFMASNRPGGHGGLDIWVATRPSRNAPFGAPQNLPEPVNSAADDFCPTPLRGDRLLFVSRRVTAESCGMGDIYLTRQDHSQGWREPKHLACDPVGPNSALDEQGPSLVKGDRGVAQLFFSRNSATVAGDLYVSERRRGRGHGREQHEDRDADFARASHSGGAAGFGPAQPVSELNSPGNDIQPNVRRDGREIVFSSNNAYPGAQGGQDIYVATRRSAGDPWSAPVNLGTAINTAAGETRPSLSWDAETLLFGRAPGPEGQSDIYMSTREKRRGR
jgi:hypothetical protein